MLELQRVAAIAGFGLLVLACGEKFTAADPAAGGSAGTGAESSAGAPAGGDPSADGGVDAGGADNAAGTPNGGRGGIGSVAGSGGKGGKSSGGSGGTIGGVGGTIGGSGGSGGVVEVPPVPLEGLELWFDANEGVTEANGVVTTWKDRSGHHRDAVQTSSMFRPKLGKSVLGGKAGVVFDGVDDYLRIASIPGDFSRGVTIFAVMQQEVDDSPCTGFFEASNGSEIDDVHVGTYQSAPLYEVAENYTNAVDHPLLLGEPQLISVVHQVDEKVQLRRNNNALIDAEFAIPANIARVAYLGHTEYDGCKAFTGTIGELLVYSRAVGDLELIDIESYLNTKWECCRE